MTARDQELPGDATVPSHPRELVPALDASVREEAGRTDASLATDAESMLALLAARVDVAAGEIADTFAALSARLRQDAKTLARVRLGHVDHAANTDLPPPRDAAGG